MTTFVRKRLCPCGCSRRLAIGERRCPESLKRADQARGNSNARGYNHSWREYSRARLLEHPTCVHCGARATMTNHKVSARARPDLFWDPKNHESVCAGCNNRQNIEREGGFGQPRRAAS